jgi:hypothetical protein
VKHPVLILHQGADPSAQAVKNELRALSVPVVSLDLGELPERGDLCVQDDVLCLGGLPLPDFPLALNRSRLTTLGSPSPRAMAERSFKTWYGRYLAEKEREAFLRSAVAILEARGTRLINPMAASDLALMRPLVLERLRSSGAAVSARQPMTPAEPFAWPQRQRGDSFLRLYRFGQATLAAGHFELQDGALPRYEPLDTLPPDAQKLADLLVQVTGVVLAAVDLVLRDGRAMFWGWDPAPAFDLFERQTGLSVAAPLAGHLAQSLP